MFIETEKGIATQMQSPKTTPKNNNSVPQNPQEKTKSNVLPSFPLKSLPKPLADFIKETAECNAGTTDGVGLGVLIALGTAIGNSAEILIDGVPEGWVESALLWGAYIADPGSNKSGITTAGMKPLKKIQKENYELYHAQYEEYGDRIEEYNRSQKNKKESGAESLPKRRYSFI